MDKIMKIYNKYGEVIFRMALYHMIDKGKDNFTDENIAATKEQIRKDDAEAQEAGKVPILGIAFQDEILDCVLELAQQSITDILLFVKENVYLKGNDSNAGD